MQGPTRKWSKLLAKLRPQTAQLARLSLHTDNPIIHSPAILPSNWPKKLNESAADFVHMHWVAGEMMSIADIGRITKPVVWTLHDMWAFCGAEHYTGDMRWQAGYQKENRPNYEARFDLNRWTWLRKKKYWQTPMHIVTPSNWLADCVKNSALMKNWPVTVIPNPLDTNRWKPLEQSLARELMGLPHDVPLVLFGALGGNRDPRKGFDLLEKALEHLRGEVDGLELVIFGQLAPEMSPDLGFPIHYTGHLHDDLSLQALYSAADVLVIPSRQDNLPNTGVEALSVGTPVISFNTGGLSDIVKHRHTGYLAQAFDTEDLANGIMWVLAQQESGDLRKNARVQAESHFSYPAVASQYLNVYRSLVG